MLNECSRNVRRSSERLVVVAGQTGRAAIGELRDQIPSHITHQNRETSVSERETRRCCWFKDLRTTECRIGWIKTRAATTKNNNRATWVQCCKRGKGETSRFSHAAAGASSNRPAADVDRLVDRPVHQLDELVLGAVPDAVMVCVAGD